MIIPFVLQLNRINVDATFFPILNFKIINMNFQNLFKKKCRSAYEASVLDREAGSGVRRDFKKPYVIFACLLYNFSIVPLYFYEEIVNKHFSKFK